MCIRDRRKVLAKIKAELAKLPKVDAPEGTPWAEALRQLENELAETKKEGVKAALVDAPMEEAMDGIKSFATDNMDVDQLDELAEYLTNVAARKRKAEETSLKKKRRK